MPSEILTLELKNLILVKGRARIQTPLSHSVIFLTSIVRKQQCLYCRTS
jgi:hypothetical protein